MPEVKVRRLTAADGAAFRDLRLEGLERDPAAFAAAFVEESRQPTDWFVERLASSDVFGAFLGDELVGLAGFKSHDQTKMAHKGLLWGMYVRASGRGRGVGRALVEAVLAHARGKVEILQLAVTTENAAARALYQACGFEAYGVERRSLKVGERYWDDVLMARAVG